MGHEHLRMDWRMTDEEREHNRKIGFDNTIKQLDEAAAKKRESQQNQSSSTSKASARAEVAIESSEDVETNKDTARTSQARLRGTSQRDRPESSSSSGGDGLSKAWSADQEQPEKPVDPSRHARSDWTGATRDSRPQADKARQPVADQGPPKTTRTPTTMRAPPAAEAKRSAPAAGIGDDRHLSSIKAAKRPSITSSSASPRSPPAEGERKPPQWYLDLPKPDNKRGREEGNADAALQYLKDLIYKAKRHHGQNLYDDLQHDFEEVRSKLHQIAFIRVDGKLLRKKRMMDELYGMPQLFDAKFAEGVEWPYDIKADAEEIYNKWYRQDFDTDIVRDIDFKGGNKIKPGKQRDAKIQGNNGLVNGQWWPALICAVRDGAHGQTVAGISGVRGKGAYSCFISGSTIDSEQYPDIDEGEVVKYCGTDAAPGASKVTDSTALMLESKLHKTPVRFMRSSKAAASGKSKYAPSEGFRYDGLYDVVEYEVLDQHIQRYRFTLVRQPGQGPIRGGEGNPWTRPTFEEIQEYKKHKLLASGKAGI